jgi:regulator of protease activity HflC (stomatin/prohibitin superfamily)
MEVRALGLKGIFTVLLVSVLGGVIGFLRTVTGLTYIRNNEVALKLRFHSAQRERTEPYVKFRRVQKWRRLSWIRYPYWVRKKDRCQGPWRIAYTGFHGGIPFIDHWATLNASEESDKTGKTPCILADQMEYEVLGVIRWKLKGDLAKKDHDPDDVFNAHFATKNLQVSIKNRTEHAMVSVASSKNYEEFIKDGKLICQEILEQLQVVTGLWGVEIIEVGFASLQASTRTEMLTQLPALASVLSKLSFTELEGHESLVAALTGSMLSLPAAQASHEQHAEDNGNDVHKDVHDSHLGLLHGLPQQARK